MTQNIFDIFDNYNEEESKHIKLQEKPINTQSVKNRVMEQTQQKKITCTSKKWYRFTAIAAAAAVLVTGSAISVSAGFDGISEFFNSLFSSESPESPEVMGSLVTQPVVDFDSSNENVEFKLLGLYGDNSQAMLSFEVTAGDNIKLSEDMASVIYITETDENGTEKELVQSGEYKYLKASDTVENTYYLNLFLREPDLQGKNLNISFNNFYTEKQIDDVFSQLQDFDTSMLKDYIIENYGEDSLERFDKESILPEEFDVDVWKNHRKEMNMDELIKNKYKELYASSEKAVSGVWSSEIIMDFPVIEPITASYSETITTAQSQASLKLDTISAQFTRPNTDDGDGIGYVLTLRDGRKIISDTWFCSRDEVDEDLNLILKENYVALTMLYGSWNEDDTEFTEVLCYSEPIEPQDIVEIKLLCSKDGNRDNISEEIIYTAQ
ncbi:MAG: hypothetical protein IJZ64_09465 [Ruminococcus sp.]|nr:hypothetical protein [Ruminococcus sp.]